MGQSYVAGSVPDFTTFYLCDSWAGAATYEPRTFICQPNYGNQVAIRLESTVARILYLSNVEIYGPVG